VKNLTSALPVGCLSAFVAVAIPAAGQQTPKAAAPAAPTRAPADQASKAESQYDFLMGDWDVAVTVRRQQGADLEYRAKWHNYWLAERQVLMQEWTEPGSKGFELRSYSRQDKKWHGRNIYVPDPGEWYDNTAELVAGEMIVTTRRKGPDGRETISREIYHDIGPDHFSIRTEVSSDGGKSWQPGGYRARMTRSRLSP